MNQPPPDVCLILEGTYPYVAGGVSAWAHDLIRAQQDLRFVLVTILPPQASLEPSTNCRPTSSRSSTCS